MSEHLSRADDVSRAGLASGQAGRAAGHVSESSLAGGVGAVLESAGSGQAARDRAIDVAISRNLALREAGYQRGIGMPRSEWERGERDDNLRHAAFLGSEVAFTPRDICMIYRMWTGSIFGENAKRPFRILVGGQPARDKRSRVRQFGSLSYARRVAREIEGKQ